jgi:hypothetical protein
MSWRLASTRLLARFSLRWSRDQFSRLAPPTRTRADPARFRYVVLGLLNRLSWRSAFGPTRIERQIANRSRSPIEVGLATVGLIDTLRLAWRTRILTHIENDLRLRLWQAAEDTAVQVFAANLHDLLLIGRPSGFGTSPRTSQKYYSARRPAIDWRRALPFAHEPWV